MRLTSISILCGVLVTFARAQSFSGVRSSFFPKNVPKSFPITSENKGTNEISTSIKHIKEIDKIKRKICKVIKKRRPCKITVDKPIDRPVKPHRKKNMTLNDPNIILSSEPADLSNNTNCMKFRFPNNYFEEGILIRTVDLWVRIKKKHKRHRKSNKRRKIMLKLSLLCNCGHNKQLILLKRLRPAKTDWHRLSIPVFVIQKLLDPESKTLQLCLKCERCNRRIQITLPLKLLKKKKNRRVRRRKPKKLRKNRPFLLIRKKDWKLKRARRQLGQCANDTETQYCCRKSEYLSFHDIGLGNDIVYPAGFYKTSCEGSCYLPQPYNSISNQNSRLCAATQTDDLRILVVSNRHVGYITVHDGEVRQCGCVNPNR